MSDILTIKKMNKIDLVIFDLDGVIVSTDEYHFLSWEQVFIEKFNIKIDREDKNIVRGISRSDSLTALLYKYNIDNLSEEEFNLLLEYKNDIYKNKLNSLTFDSANEGIVDLIEFIKNKGIKTIIGSASKNAPYILEKLGLKKYFDNIVEIDDQIKSKPNPDIFLKASTMMGIKPNKCLVIEDAQAGIDAAKAAGMKVIGYSEESKLYNYDAKVNNHKEVIELLKIWMKEK